MFDYEPFLERDAEGIRAAVREYRSAHSSDELFETVARFAVLAYAPSQHSKHALLACLAAYDIRQEAPEAWDDWLTECAIYAAGSRQPWTEPPILDPPPVSAGQKTDADELRAAVESGDRLRGERWLAARVDDPALRNDYFSVACDDFEDLGHKLIVSNAAWRLAGILGERGRFAVLRIGIWEMCAYRGERYVERGDVAQNLISGLVSSAVVDRGSLESMHRVFLYDAAVQCGMVERVSDFLSNEIDATSVHDPSIESAVGETRPYTLGRDYAALLQSQAVARRLGDPRIAAAARANLESGESFEEWSFA